MTVTEELKPCPFCGAKAHLEAFSDGDGYEAHVYCVGDGCEAEMRYFREDKDEAKAVVVAAWNKRSSYDRDR